MLDRQLYNISPLLASIQWLPLHSVYLSDTRLVWPPGMPPKGDAPVPLPDRVALPSPPNNGPSSPKTDQKKIKGEQIIGVEPGVRIFCPMAAATLSQRPQ